MHDYKILKFIDFIQHLNHMQTATTYMATTGHAPTRMSCISILLILHHKISQSILMYIMWHPVCTLCVVLQIQFTC